MALLVAIWHAAGHPGLTSARGDLLVLGMAANFGGYLNLVPWFRSDGIHLLAHLHAARLSPGTRQELTPLARTLPQPP